MATYLWTTVKGKSWVQNHTICKDRLFLGLKDMSKSYSDWTIVQLKLLLLFYGVCHQLCG